MRRSGSRPRIRVRFTFLLFNAVIFLVCSSSYIMTFYTVCAVHEAGHIIAAELLGVRIRSVELSGLGIVMHTDKSRLIPIRTSLMVLAAGPAVNLLIFAFMHISGRTGTFAVLNLAAALYNLLPFSALDGGAMIELLCTGSPRECVYRRWINAVRIGLVVMLMIVLASRTLL